MFNFHRSIDPRDKSHALHRESHSRYETGKFIEVELGHYESLLFLEEPIAAVNIDRNEGQDDSNVGQEGDQGKLLIVLELRQEHQEAYPYQGKLQPVVTVKPFCVLAGYLIQLGAEIFQEGCTYRELCA